MNRRRWWAVLPAAAAVVTLASTPANAANLQIDNAGLKRGSWINATGCIAVGTATIVKDDGPRMRVRFQSCGSDGTLASGELANADPAQITLTPGWTYSRLQAYTLGGNLFDTWTGVVMTR
ncbi:hypothetical protein QT196_39275 (plasmid) [Streptomyces sp. P9-2B-2]|uniref:hypothetical protein n=1 Tax=Streptomyces sp. P9-2B-2 TaxID=3057114 RepID=UPI0025B61152|nr:hypothetical protein [Streptomyces sp. P9-2B-2]WJY43298.1 hypothetical protein QT196_39275 [Streptomyces sp. P9-2B-2]